MKKYAYLSALIAILIDQITKYIVATQMTLGQDIPIIQDFFHITFLRNEGAAWSILEGKMLFFYVITLFAVIFFVYYIQKLEKHQMLLAVGLGLMLGGAIGNFIDRLFFQSVVDFIHFYIFSYDFPIFNFADIFLNVGIGLILLDSILEMRKERKHG